VHTAKYHAQAPVRKHHLPLHAAVVAVPCYDYMIADELMRWRLAREIGYRGEGDCRIRQSTDNVCEGVYKFKALPTATRSTLSDSESYCKPHLLTFLSLSLSLVLLFLNLFLSVYLLIHLLIHLSFSLWICRSVIFLSMYYLCLRVYLLAYILTYLSMFLSSFPSIFLPRTLFTSRVGQKEKNFSKNTYLL
jgi:hypothetical protein